MIGRITGTLLEKHPPQVLVEAAGVGYEVDVPMSTFFSLPAIGERVVLLTHFVVREDAQLLYGFLTQKERGLSGSSYAFPAWGPRWPWRCSRACPWTNWPSAWPCRKRGA